MRLTDDHLQRVYAGVLGKIIGVYAGRPVEQWSHERIVQELGEVDGYVAGKMGRSLVVADDDISGAFTFIRALEDYESGLNITPEQIGRTWMNYLVEGRTVLWWGGMCRGTEHTAYLRMKGGIWPPASGSMTVNGPTVAEQIGAQSFIDGWAMVCPCNPKRAASLARRAGSVSHDGVALDAAAMIAAMESAAFEEKDLNKLLDIGLATMPTSSTVSQVLADLRQARSQSDDWHDGLKVIRQRYGYDRWPGGCHVIPNIAVVLMSLLWGESQDAGQAFRTSLKIANTAGYDTGCNAGTVGCFQGIRLGMVAFDGGYDFRGPVADRLLLPTADGGNCVNDAASVAVRVANIARKLAGAEMLAPKGGARFHFTLPGSVQGWMAEGTDTQVSHSEGRLTIRLENGMVGAASVATFREKQYVGGQEVMACPTLYAGQRVIAWVDAAAGNAGAVRVTLLARYFKLDETLAELPGQELSLAPGEHARLDWKVPDTQGLPVGQLVVRIEGQAGCAIMIDAVDWQGVPTTTFVNPAMSEVVASQWVNAVDSREKTSENDFAHGKGRGLLTIGCRDWSDFKLNVELTTWQSRSAGVVVCVQGLGRYYALMHGSDGILRLIKVQDGEKLLASAALPWRETARKLFTVEVSGSRISAWVDQTKLISVNDSRNPLLSGAVGMAVEDGRLSHGVFEIEAL